MIPSTDEFIEKVRQQAKREAIKEVIEEIEKLCLGSEITGKNIFGMDLQKWTKLKFKLTKERI